MAARLSAQCPFCTEYSTSSFKNLLSHIGLVHANAHNFQISCGADNCGAVYTNFRRFKEHLKRKHGEQFQLSQSTGIEGGGTTHDDIESLRVNEGFFDQNQEQVDDGLAQKRQLALWILKVKEKRKLTQSTLDEILSDITELFNTLLGNLQGKITKVLQAAEIDSSVVSSLSSCFSNEIYCNPFKDLSTSYKQLEFYKKHLNFVEPQAIDLSNSCIPADRVNKDCYMYVSILKTIETLLNDHQIFNQVMGGRIQSSNKLMDVCDGKRYKEHPLYSGDKTALQVMMYFDELEVCNPIGSNRKKHKLGCFYFTLGNLLPVYRSKLQSIQLVALIKVIQLNTYGIDSVIQRITQDIKKLEKGYTFNTAEGPKVLKGTIITCLGDNLGSHAMGGFKEGASAERPCRHCMINKKELNVKFCEKDVVLRNRESHQHYCSILAQADARSRKEYSTTWGINRDSVLNTLQFCHVCEELLPPDIMHDLLEGYLPYLCKLMLCEVRSFGITIKFINDAMENFSFGLDEKPSLIPESALKSMDTHLGQSASKMWSLGRLLPMIIGTKIPADNPNWLHYLQLLDIIDLVFSPIVDKHTPAYLQDLIENNLKTFTELYPEASFIPKMHFLLHIPRFLERLGPLIYHWTMRFEAKHKYFKSLATTMGNFINILYSLAIRHQCLQTYISAEGSMLQESISHVGKGSVIDVNATSFPDQLKVQMNGIHEIFSTASVEINGVKYKCGHIIILGRNELDECIPQFGKIKEIFIKESEILFGIYELVTLEYNNHYHSWMIEDMNEINLKKLIHFNNLHNHQCLLPRCLPDHLYSFITLKYSFN